MGGVDSFLNAVIPIGAILFFGFAIFKAFAPQFREFGEWIRGIFAGKKEKVDPMYGGSIQYT